MPSRKEIAQFFFDPVLPVAKQYEGLRAYFVEECSARKIALRLGYTLSSFQTLVRDFKVNLKEGRKPEFFISHRPGPKSTPKKDIVRMEAITLRKRNYSIYDIQALLEAKGHIISHTAISEILREEGFARLPKRSKAEVRQVSISRPNIPEVTDVRQLNLSGGRKVTTEYGGLFLFLPILSELGLEEIVATSKYPGTNMIPAVSAILSHLVLKLIDKERHSHINDLNFDEGVGLFAGLNLLPKSTAISSYSYRTTRSMNLCFLEKLIHRIHTDILLDAKVFNLDFHPVPHRGEESVLERHWIPSRGKAFKSVLTFFAQDSDTRILCYSNAQVYKRSQSEEVLKFVEFWKRIKGCYPTYLLFDSKLTTYQNLSQLNQRDIYFITIRKRGTNLLKQALSKPKTAWQECRIDTPKRRFQKVKFIDTPVTIKDYEGKIRQLILKDLGRESPTFMLTNDIKSSARNIITLYSQRARIENSIGENVNFFHLDCLSSDLALNVDFDVTTTVLASLLYRILASKLSGFESCGPKLLFRKFILSKATVMVTPQAVKVYFSKRSHNPIVKAAALDKTAPPVTWLGNRRTLLIYP